MFNGSYLRVCRILRFVKKIRFSLQESGWTKPWCPSLVSRPKPRNQWQEVEGLLFSPQKIIFSHLESGWTKPWCPGLVSRPSAKAQEPVARIRGLVIQPPKLSVGAYFELSFLGQLVHILSFHSQGVVSLFIFPTGTIALDSEPRGRRYVKNTGHNSYCLYSRAIHCPAIMEMHYVQ